MTDRETDELGTVSAEEVLIRSSVKDISSDLAEEASMFAAASESSAPADGVGIVPAKRSSGSRRTVFGIATSAIVAVIFCAASIVLYLILDKKSPPEPQNTSSVSILTSAPGETAPAETDPPTLPPTPVPTETPFPTPVPTETPEPTGTLAQTPTEIPTQTPTLPPTPGPTPDIPDYYRSYSAWLAWREENKEDYRQWQNTVFPEKPHSGNFDGIDEQWFYTPTFVQRFTARVNHLPYEFAEAMGYINDSYYDKDGYYSQLMKQTADTRSYPGIVYQIRTFGVPKAELLEYVKWQTASPYFTEVVFSAEEVELLYSEDIDRMRREFPADGAVLCGDQIFSYYEIEYFIDPYDFARIFTPESLAEYAKKYYGNPEGLRDRYRACVETYRLITERDKGKLKTATAAELLDVLFELYEGLRYDAGIWISGKGAPRFDYKPALQIFWEVLKPDVGPTYPQKKLYSIMMPGLAYCIDCDGGISDRFNITADDDDGMAFNADPAYYDGPVLPFGDGYRLIDHIEIVDNSDTRAAVNIRCLCRDGVTEQTYTAVFTKDNGKWRISGGSVLELLTDTAEPTVTVEEIEERMIERDRLEYLEIYGQYKPLKDENDFVTFPVLYQPPGAGPEAYAYTEAEWEQIRQLYYSVYTAETASSYFGRLDRRATRYNGMIYLERRLPRVEDVAFDPAMILQREPKPQQAFLGVTVSDFIDGKVRVETSYELYGVTYSREYNKKYNAKLIFAREGDAWKIESFDGALTGS